MLDFVIVAQFFGLLVAAPVVIGLTLFFARLNKELFPYFYLIYLFTLSSLQTWQALAEVRWIAHTSIALTLSLATLGVVSLVRTRGWTQISNTQEQVRALPRFARFVFFLLTAALVNEVLFAAFPSYRYDQYNYHLITPKLVALYNKLPPFMGTDHTHFTGSWEFFFTSFRSLISNDLLIQTITTTFTFLSYVVPASALLWSLARPSRFKPLWLVGLPALVIYTHNELEPIISAKPDFVLVACALAIIAAQKLSLKPRLFFSTFFLLAGLSFKNTWLHAGAALSLGVLLCLWRDRNQHALNTWLKKGALPTLAGLSWAALCATPVFIKNIYFFGNPIHPTQAGPFKSETATRSFLEYWKHIAQRPTEPQEMLLNFLNVIPQNIKLMTPVIFILLVCFLSAWKLLKRSKAHAPDRIFIPLKNHSPWLVAWACYLVFWALLFRFDIYNRFVAVVCIFPLILIATFGRYVRSANRLAFALLTPFVINSATEVKLKKMWRAKTQNYAEYSRVNFSPSIQDFREAHIIHAHAQDLFGQNWRDKCNIFTNKPNHYFYNTRLIAFDDQNFEHHVENFGKATFEQCPWGYLQSIQGCYLIATHEYEFKDWPEPLSQFVAQADTNLATGENADLRLLYISPETVQEQILTQPGCEALRSQQSQDL